MAQNIVVTQIDGIPYTTRPMAVCSTAAATVAKTADCDGFSLMEGATLIIMFINGNTASNPTLNVNGTGARGLYCGGDYLLPNVLKTYTFYEAVFDGVYWQILGSVQDHYRNTVSTQNGTDTSGTEITIPVITTNSYGHVTKVGTRKHTVPGVDTSVIDTLQSTITQQQRQIDDLKSVLDSIITGKTWSTTIWGSGTETTPSLDDDPSETTPPV